MIALVYSPFATRHITRDMMRSPCFKSREHLAVQQIVTSQFRTPSFAPLSRKIDFFRLRTVEERRFEYIFVCVYRYIYRYTVLSTQVHARGLDEISVFHDTGVLREFKIPLTTLPYSRARVICRYTCRRQKGRRRRRRYTGREIYGQVPVYLSTGEGRSCSMPATVKVIPSSPLALARICSINEGWQTVTGL